MAVIGPTIIRGVEDSAALIEFYERAYSLAGPEADRYARWRSLSAIGKADHVIELCNRAGVIPAATLDVGCGDGALIGELQRRGFGGRLAGMEISEPAAAIARAGPAAARRSPSSTARRCRSPTAPIELGVLSHVLEHAPRPAGAARRGGARLRHGRLRGAAGGELVGGTPRQAPPRRGDRPPASPQPRGTRERSPPRRGCAWRRSFRTRCRWRCTASSPRRAPRGRKAWAKWSMRAAANRLAPRRRAARCSRSTTPLLCRPPGA